VRNGLTFPPPNMRYLSMTLTAISCFSYLCFESFKDSRDKETFTPSPPCGRSPETCRPQSARKALRHSWTRGQARLCELACVACSKLNFDVAKINIPVTVNSFETMTALRRFYSIPTDCEQVEYAWTRSRQDSRTLGKSVYVAQPLYRHHFLTLQW
jgi:hypothetical protein